MTSAEWELDTVYILGAGFSKACYPEMPLTDLLGERVANELKASIDSDLLREFSQGVDAMGFESYLSLLAERHPHQTDGEWLTAQKLLAEALPQIADVVLDSQRNCDRNSRPWWLPVLLEIVGLSSSGIVTFNYDTIIEDSWPRHWGPLASSLGAHPSEVPVRYEGNYGFFAQPDPGSADVGLFKLHGSINWLANPVDQHGSTLQIEEFDLQLKEHRSNESQRASRALQPVIVPPTSMKAAALQRSFIATLWKIARLRIQKARRVVFIGYSMPTTDRAAVQLLRDAWRNKSKDLVIVDQDAEGVEGRLMSVGLVGDTVKKFGGAGAVEAYVRSELIRIAGEAELSVDDVRDFRESGVRPQVTGPTVRDAAIGAFAKEATGTLVSLTKGSGELNPVEYGPVSKIETQPFKWLIEDPSNSGRYLPVYTVRTTRTTDPSAVPSTMSLLVGSPVPLDAVQH